MKRAYNFNAGPSAMPESVLKEAQAEFLNYKNTGMGIIEMSHRSSEYAAMHQETKDLLRELMEIPDNYEILFAGRRQHPVYDGGSQFSDKRAGCLCKYRGLG